MGEITGSNSGAPLWMNSELALEENVLSSGKSKGRCTMDPQVR
jgi:hypothetical protein